PGPAITSDTSQRLAVFHDGANGSLNDYGIYSTHHRDASGFPYMPDSSQNNSSTQFNLVSEAGKMDSGRAYPGTPNNIAASFVEDNLQFRQNGSNAVKTDSGGVVPAGLAHLRDGANPIDDTLPFAGTVNRIAVYSGP